jgi:hypothetical protein
VDDHLNPRSRLVGHPLAPFLTAPQLPNADHGLGTPMEPTPGTGLRKPLVLTAPSFAPDLGRAVDLLARVIDSYLLTCQHSTAPPDLASFWLHGVFLPDTPDSSYMIISACSLDRRWLLEKVHALTDIPPRVRNIFGMEIGMEIAHRARWTASTTRTPHPAMPQQHDRTPLPAELSNGHQEVRLDIPTSCAAVGLLFQLASRQREFPSGGPMPPNAAMIPNLTTTLKQEKIQIVRAVHVPAMSGRRVRISSPMFTHLSGPDVVPLLHALLLDRLASELTDTCSAYTTTPTPRVEDLPKPAQPSLGCVRLGRV